MFYLNKCLVFFLLAILISHFTLSNQTADSLEEEEEEEEEDFYYQKTKQSIAFQILKHESEDKDPFLTLNEEELQKYWSSHSKTSLIKKIEHLEHSFEEKLYVEIKLLGFSDQILNQKELESALENVIPSRFLTVVNSTEGKNSLFIKKKLLYHISKINSPIVTQIEDTISNQLKTGRRRLSFEIVDSHVQTLLQSSDTYTIFLFNFNLEQKYLHSYIDGSQSYTEFETSCGSPFWIGTERYIWIDLTAKSLQIGPHLNGEGLIVPQMFPSLEHFKNSKDLSLQLAAFFHSICDYLLAPSIQRFPIQYKPNLTLYLIRIHDSPGTDFPIFKWNKIKEEIGKIPRFYDQKLEFKEKHIYLKDCSMCSFILSLASKHFFGSNPTEIKSYLSSPELYFYLKQIEHEFMEENPDIVPIFLFDLTFSKVKTLDLKFQSVSYPDMVITIQNHNAGLDLSEFTCNNLNLFIDLRDATRSVLASLLTTVWGVVPTYQRWSLIHNKLTTNYIWGLGRTPFGIFSDSLELSFVQTDSAVKHILFSQLHSILSEINLLFSHYEEYGFQVDEVFSASENLQFIRRWNFFQWKVYQTQKYLSLNEFNNSFSFIRSMKFDSDALHSLIHSAGKKLHTKLECNIESQWDNNSILPQILYYFKTFFIISPLFSVLSLIPFIAKYFKIKRS